MMGELGGTDEVAKYYGKMAAFAFQPISFDCSPERVLRLRLIRGCAPAQCSSARITELGIVTIFGSTRRATERKLYAAFVAKACTFPIFSSALRAAHRTPPVRDWRLKMLPHVPEIPNPSGWLPIAHVCFVGNSGKYHVGQKRNGLVKQESISFNAINCRKPAAMVSAEAGGLTRTRLQMEDQEMAVSAVVTFQVRDGRHGEQLENFKAVKRLVERAGGTFRVYRQIFGSQVNHLVAVSEYKDRNGFAKVRSDPEFSQLVERIRSNANPAADLVGGDVYEELTV
jgi:hypothetical protein